MPTLGAGALLYPLQEEDVREAYFLGSGDRSRAANFLGHYIREYPKPSRGSWVYSIEFRTPYEQIVLRSWRNGASGYSAQDAQREYETEPGKVAIRVGLSFGPGYTSALTRTYGNPEGEETLDELRREFPVRVTQDKPIVPSRMSALLSYSRNAVGARGAVIHIEFSALQFGPGVVQVEVGTPDGPQTEASFDLDQLK